MNKINAMTISLISKGSQTYLGNLQLPFFNKTSLRVLNLLKHEGFVRGFNYNQFSMTIYFKFGGTSNIPAIKKIKSISTSSRYVSLVLKSLKNLSHINETLLMFTNRGPLTGKMGLRYATGGFVVAKVV